MAHPHNNGDGPGAQSAADTDSANSPCDLCRVETPPPADCTATVSGVTHYDSGWNTGAVFPKERLIVGAREHDDGRLARWIYDMVFGRWTQAQPVDGDAGPGTGCGGG